jgi:hypothetical protein
VERIVLWTQVITGTELDVDGNVRALDAESWDQRGKLAPGQTTSEFCAHRFGMAAQGPTALLPPLPRATKCNPGVLTKVALVVLLGRGLDLALMVLPTLPEQEPILCILDLALLLGGGGLASLIILSSLSKAPPIPYQGSLPDREPSRRLQMPRTFMKPL